MVLGAFVTYVPRSSRAAQPRTSTAFLRAGADFGGGFSSLPLCCWSAVVSGGRVWCVASSRSYRRLKPLSIHTISRARMQTSSLEFYHTQSPPGCSTAPHTAQRLHTLAPGRKHAGLRRSGSCRGYSSRQLPLRRGWRQGPASSSQASTMSWRTAGDDEDLQDKSARHGRSASGSGR